MDLVLDISTSMEFWRTVYPVNRAPSPSGLAAVGEYAYNEEDVLRLAPEWVKHAALYVGDDRVHAMVFSREHRRRSASHRTHVWTGPLPEGSFYRLEESVLVASPEFIFLVSALVLSLPKLIAFGCELCGHYGFDETGKRGFRKRSRPLTTVQQLGDFLNAAVGCKGRKNALRALQYIFPNSASPMETFDAMAMSLPLRLGGYGIYRPVMNREIQLTEKAARIAGRRKCYLDMCFTSKSAPGLIIDVEHHGKLDHSSEEARMADIARVNALKEMGLEVIELTKGQVNDLETFELIILRIARMLGKRIKKADRGYNHARNALRCEVFEWNHSSGRLR